MNVGFVLCFDVFDFSRPEAEFVTARSMGKIRRKDFGEPGSLDKILEECHVIYGWTG